jgi:tetratricopeptide (TPR) repeat protein
VLRSRAYIDRVFGHPDRALRRYAEAQALLGEGTGPQSEAALLRSLGSLHLELGNYADAMSYLERAGKLSHDTGDLRGQTMVLYRLGELHLAEGQPGKAEKVLTEAMRNVDTDIRNLRGQAYARYSLGLARFQLGDHDQAAALLTDALAIAREVGEHLIQTRVLLALAEYHRHNRRPDRAITLLTEATTLCHRDGSPQWLARSLRALGDAHDRAGDTAAARRCRDQAREAETASGAKANPRTSLPQQRAQSRARDTRSGTSETPAAAADVAPGIPDSGRRLGPIGLRSGRPGGRRVGRGDHPRTGGSRWPT